MAKAELQFVEARSTLKDFLGAVHFYRPLFIRIKKIHSDDKTATNLTCNFIDNGIKFVCALRKSKYSPNWLEANPKTLDPQRVPEQAMPLLTKLQSLWSNTAGGSEDFKFIAVPTEFYELLKIMYKAN